MQKNWCEKETEKLKTCETLIQYKTLFLRDYSFDNFFIFFWVKTWNFKFLTSFITQTRVKYNSNLKKTNVILN
jgi:hypothetical protein